MIPGIVAAVRRALGAPFFVTASDTIYAVSTQQNKAIPAQTQAGDLVLAFVMHRDTLTIPPNWQIVLSCSASGPSLARHDLTVLRKVALPGDAGATVTWTQATSQRIAVHYHVYRAVNAQPVVQLAMGLTQNGIVTKVMPWAPLPTLAPRQIAIAASTISLARGSGNTTITTTGGIMTTPAAAPDNRLAVAYQPAVGTLAGSFTSSIDDTGPAAAIASISVLVGSQFEDRFQDNVVALLHFDGSDGSTSFIDQKGRIWTANGNAQIDTAQQRFGPSALLLDGSGDFLSTPDDPAFSLGALDFTIECWARPSSVAADFQGLIGHCDTSINQMGWLFRHRSNGDLEFAYSPDGTIANHTTVSRPAGLQVDTWYHLAVCRRGTELRLFKDGVQLGATHNIGATAIFDANTTICIGQGDQSGSEFWSGWIDDVRITVGVARYTENFTPPDRPFPNGADA